MARFFLNRPVFAWVIAIGIMLAGVIAINMLPVSQYPPIAPPSISIRGMYPGASAKTVEDTVVQVIEQNMTGLDRMLYMSSKSNSMGTAQIELTFAPGTDPDMAWAKVQNKLQLAMPSLPETVQRLGLSVAKSTRNFLMIVALTCEDGSLDQDDLMDYAISQVQTTLARVPGVGEVEALAAQYAMRIWLDPHKLTNYGMTPSDIIAGIRTHNVQVSAGQYGGTPAVPGQRLNATITVQNLLKTPEEFGAIPLRNNPDGSVVRVRDVARAELGTEFSQFKLTYNDGHPAAALAIRQMAGANALDTADNVKAAMEELSRYFPAGMKVAYPNDTTPFIRVAISEVVHTLIVAIILVFLVMYLFLGNIRATIIPTIAVPVVILGTFAVLSVFGYSINMLTMFAMVLAIGLLVDDAIVVVENVERIMSEEGLPPLEATRKSMDEITGALVGIGLVISAVFVPMMFFGGSTGIIYRQFSITIISSMILSVLVALILTPVLCANLLKPEAPDHEAAETRFRPLRSFFRWFNRLFNRVRDGYRSAVAHILGFKLPYVAAFVLIVALTGFFFMRMPTGYLPDEDQGALLTIVQLPPGSTQEQTVEVLEKIRDHFLNNEKETVQECLTVAGVSSAGGGQDQGMVYIKLKDWDLRDSPELKAEAIVGRAIPVLAAIRNARIYPVIPPAVVELGMARGFDFMLQDRAGLGHEKLMQARLQLMGMAMQDPRLASVRPNGMEDTAQHKIDIDWDKAGAMGVSVSEVQNAISVAFGSAYVNDFIQGGRVKRVYVQADAPFRMLPEHLDHFYVRNRTGGMVPISALATSHWYYDSPLLERFNGFPSLNFQGEPAPGRSSGEAMKVMEELASRLPQGFGHEWTGLSYQERISSQQTVMLYAFSVLAIFLVLAALYESWSIPVTILLTLPLGVIGGVLASTLRGLPNDVYFQIGLLTVLGLTTKNAILIVQFAKVRVENGMGLIEATLEGVRLRLRPIVMTSLAFGFGVLPLAISSGAGAGAQKALGTSVLGGMITATFLAIFFIPLFFVIVSQLFGRKKRAPHEA
ncbi:MAG: efflux RND transporter permease subunit [Acidobacteriota bacterium]|jgi:HAE1 family hydrophobic/amphiphilic exporter-1|nr:efflux RND transporter permease subunit [Acidobacteriota bacterium]